MRATIPDDIAFDSAAEFIGSLLTITAFDLGQGRLESFGAYRFLYERLLGGAVRPWLPSTFLAAAALPCLHPSTRKMLLGSVTASDAAASAWSSRDAAFMPEWVEKVPVTVC
jgi:hypothetical protein